jgi:hypothetical protein
LEWFKQRDVLTPLFFNFALDYASSSVQVNQNDMNLNSKYQLLVYADGVNILGGSVNTHIHTQKKKKTL